MTMSITIDGQGPSEVATNHGWGNLLRWLDSLEGDELAPLFQLAIHGLTEAPRETFMRAIMAAVEKDPPDEVRTVLRNIINAAVNAPEDATVFMATDGMTGDDDKDDEPEVEEEPEEEPHEDESS